MFANFPCKGNGNGSHDVSTIMFTDFLDADESTKKYFKQSNIMLSHNVSKYTVLSL